MQANSSICGNLAFYGVNIIANAIQGERDGSSNIIVDLKQNRKSLQYLRMITNNTFIPTKTKFLPPVRRAKESFP